MPKKFWERRWVKNLFILYEGDAHILTDFDPPPLISMCFPGFLVPTYVLNTGGNVQKILLPFPISFKRPWHPMDVENTNRSNGRRNGRLGWPLPRQEERLRREIAQEQLGAKRPLEKCKASGGIGQGCTRIVHFNVGPWWMGKSL